MLQGGVGQDVSAAVALGDSYTAKMQYQAAVPNTTGVPATPASGLNNTSSSNTVNIKASPGVVARLRNVNQAASSFGPAEFIVYDNTAASGTIVWRGWLSAGESADLQIPCSTGITVYTADAFWAVTWA